MSRRGVERVQPPSSFFNPQLILKNNLGVRINPLEQRSVTQRILLSACIQRFPTRSSFRMIRLRVQITFEVGGAILCIYAYVLWITRDQKLKRGRMLYRVAQNKWGHLLKLYMGCLLTIKINYNGIVVSVCVFSMVKPVQCLLNMDGKGTLSISDCMFHII